MSGNEVKVKSLKQLAANKVAHTIIAESKPKSIPKTRLTNDSGHEAKLEKIAHRTSAKKVKGMKLAPEIKKKISKEMGRPPNRSWKAVHRK